MWAWGTEEGQVEHMTAIAETYALKCYILKQLEQNGQKWRDHSWSMQWNSANYFFTNNFPWSTRVTHTHCSMKHACFCYGSKVPELLKQLSRLNLGFSWMGDLSAHCFEFHKGICSLQALFWCKSSAVGISFPAMLRSSRVVKEGKRYFFGELFDEVPARQVWASSFTRVAKSLTLFVTAVAKNILWDRHPLRKLRSTPGHLLPGLPATQSSPVFD